MIDLHFAARQFASADRRPASRRTALPPSPRRSKGSSTISTACGPVSSNAAATSCRFRFRQRDGGFPEGRGGHLLLPPHSPVRRQARRAKTDGAGRHIDFTCPLVGRSRAQSASGWGARCRKRPPTRCVSLRSTIIGLPTRGSAKGATNALTVSHLMQHTRKNRRYRYRQPQFVTASFWIEVTSSYVTKSNTVNCRYPALLDSGSYVFRFGYSDLSIAITSTGGGPDYRTSIWKSMLALLAEIKIIGFEST